MWHQVPYQFQHTMSRKFIKLNARREHDSRFVVAVPKAFTYTKRERRVFTNQHEAEAYANNVIYRGYIQAEAIRSNGENKKLSTGSLGQWIEKYLIELHVRGSMTSWRTKRHTLGRLEETFGHRPINSITRDDLLVWIQSIKGVPYTKLNHQSHARSFFRWCIEDVDDPPIDRNQFAGKTASALSIKILPFSRRNFRRLSPVGKGSWGT